MISLIINKEAYGSEIKGDRGYKKDYTPISQGCRRLRRICLGVET